jgi:hypothetical protein
MSEQTQKLSEFDAIGELDADTMTIQTLDSEAISESEFKQLLEKRITRAIDPVTKSILDDIKLGNTSQVDAVMDSIKSKIPSIQISQYFRAGKNYYTINHKFGHVGNLFFKALFESLLNENQGHSYIITQENSICVICRS